jgi:hypothetical protein
VDIGAFDTSGFVNSPVDDQVSMQSFGLEINVRYDQTRIAQCSGSSFGFNQALACDCIPYDYSSNDEIVVMTILAQDVLSDQTTDVTENFESEYYGSPSMLDFRELFLGYEGNREKLQFDLISDTNIPLNAIFIVNVELESGLVLSSTTRQISFVD